MAVPLMVVSSILFTLSSNFWSVIWDRAFWGVRVISDCPLLVVMNNWLAD